MGSGFVSVSSGKRLFFFPFLSFSFLSAAGPRLSLHTHSHLFNQRLQRGPAQERLCGALVFDKLQKALGPRRPMHAVQLVGDVERPRVGERLLTARHVRAFTARAGRRQYARRQVGRAGATLRWHRHLRHLPLHLVRSLALHLFFFVSAAALDFLADSSSSKLWPNSLTRVLSTRYL